VNDTCQAESTSRRSPLAPPPPPPRRIMTEALSCHDGAVTVRAGSFVEVGFPRGRAVATIPTTGLFDDIALWDAAQGGLASRGSGSVAPGRAE
jgi:hypothetical protein